VFADVSVKLAVYSAIQYSAIIQEFKIIISLASKKNMFGRKIY
jgi:hypothetical protein